MASLCPILCTDLWTTSLPTLFYSHCVILSLDEATVNEGIKIPLQARGIPLDTHFPQSGPAFLLNSTSLCSSFLILNIKEAEC